MAEFDTTDPYYNMQQLASRCEHDGYAHAIVDRYSPAEVREWNVPEEVKADWLAAREHLKALFEVFDLVSRWAKPDDGRALFEERFGADRQQEGDG